MNTMQTLSPLLSHLRLPQPNSHKGQNGKLMIIGGSELFHAASKWSLDTASKFVDMVFYSSVPSNNTLIQQAKGGFWNGIVVPREDVESYIDEADCVLIGPGMERTAETAEVTNHLLRQFPQKKWIIDAGALQMVDVQLLNEKCILTPHHGEWARLEENAGVKKVVSDRPELLQQSELVQKTGATFVLKGQADIVFNRQEAIVVEGGNAGMTKGGTGDVLAGLIAGLYTTNDQWISAVAGSFINKKAGDELYKKVGPNFNASDLVNIIPQVLWQELQHS